MHICSRMQSQNSLQEGCVKSRWVELFSQLTGMACMDNKAHVLWHSWAMQNNSKYYLWYWNWFLVDSDGSVFVWVTLMPKSSDLTILALLSVADAIQSNHTTPSTWAQTNDWTAPSTCTLYYWQYNSHCVTCITFWARAEHQLPSSLPW